MSETELRPATTDDSDFLHHLHQATMKEYVTQVWEWDESWQRQYFEQHFNPAHNRIIRFQNKDIGVVFVMERETELFLSSIEVYPEYQRQGIGTSVITTILHEGKRLGKSVALQVLKVNPARMLYARLGFMAIGETQTHYLMKAALQK